MDDIFHKKAGKFMSKGLLFKNHSPITNDILWFYKIDENLWRTCSSRKIAVSALEEIYGDAFKNPIKVWKKNHVDNDTKTEGKGGKKTEGKGGKKTEGKGGKKTEGKGGKKTEGKGGKKTEGKGGKKTEGKGGKKTEGKDEKNNEKKTSVVRKKIVVKLRKKDISHKEVPIIAQNDSLENIIDNNTGLGNSLNTKIEKILEKKSFNPFRI